MYFSREEEAHLHKMLGWKEALALIGPRRVGKTSLALKLVENWRVNGGEAQYFDLESLNAPRTAGELARKISATPKKSLVVLDEVQTLAGWIKVVRQEIEKNTRHVLVTGSSAELLSKEIASSLAGRAIPETILPLSFRDAKKWGVSSLEQYLNVGGYPECVLRPNDAPRLHKLYLQLTILRDVAARKNVREVKPLSDLALILLSEPGKTISAKKTAGLLEISQPTFRSFVSALNDAFLILSVPPFKRSPREKIVADAKHYAFDTGLQKNVSESTQEDRGRRVENLVAIELVRKGYSLSHLKLDDCECDFIAQKPGSPKLAVQVWSGSSEVPEREWRGLTEAMKKTSSGEALFLSLNEANVEESEELKKLKKLKAVEALTIEEWLERG